MPEASTHDRVPGLQVPTEEARQGEADQRVEALQRRVGHGQRKQAGGGGGEQGGQQALGRHPGRPGLPPLSNSPLDNIYTPPSPLRHNACKPEVPSQVELPLVEFLPHMEESIDIANYLGQEQAFSNCNEDAELLFNSSCHTLTDLTNANDNDSYSFYI